MLKSIRPKVIIPYIRTFSAKSSAAADELLVDKTFDGAANLKRQSATQKANVSPDQLNEIKQNYETFTARFGLNVETEQKKSISVTQPDELELLTQSIELEPSEATPVKTRNLNTQFDSEVE